MIEGRITQGLKAVLERELPGSVALKHVVSGTAGAPDLSESWHGMTIWLEVKHLNPALVDDLRQRHAVWNMARVAPIYYVLYAGPKVRRAEVRTALVEPLIMTVINYCWNWNDPQCLLHAAALSPKAYDHATIAHYLRSRMERNEWTSKMSGCFISGSG